MDILKHTAKKNKKIKRAGQILPEVYGTTLSREYGMDPNCDYKQMEHIRGYLWQIFRNG